MYCRFPRVSHCSVVPFHEQLLALGFAKQRQSRNLDARVLRTCGQQTLEVAYHASDRRGIEKIGVVAEGGIQSVVIQGEFHREVEFLSRVVKLKQTNARLRWRAARNGRVFRGENNLEERVTTHVAIQP